MSNLLPHPQQKEARRMYRVRIITTFLWLFTSVAIVGVLMLFSSFVLLQQQENIVEIESQTLAVERQNIENKDFTKIIADVRSRLSLFVRKDYRTVNIVEDVISPILEKHIKTIRIERIGYTTQNDVASVEIRGVAKNREQLLAFVNALRSIPNFEQVIVPISFFAERDTLDFVITFNLKTT